MKKGEVATRTEVIKAAEGLINLWAKAYMRQRAEPPIRMDSVRSVASLVPNFAQKCSRTK
jgi:hypothetical protein